MNEFQKRRQMQSQQQFPGCMGRMINMFDLSSSMPRTKLLTDRAHGDDSPTCTNKSNMVNQQLNSVGIHIKDKPMVNEMKKSSSNKNSCGTPMKMLIAQEMSKEIESNRKPPGVVAKLMGLDAMPVQQPLSTRQRSLRESYSHSHAKEYKDVYEVRQRPSRANCVNDQWQSKGKLNEHSNQKKMALVRQKFTEAKRLAADKSFLHSKQFQDALEVLSSNRDLFLKFLEEPNSLLSKHLNEINTTASSGQTRHITVLKPSNAVETKGQRRALEENIQDKDKHHSLTTRNLSHPTRIVVLKPSPGKPCEFKTLAANQIFSPKLLEEKGLSKDLNCINSNRRDDSLLSSVLSNGYIGDESSFNRSEHEYVEEASDNVSDSEIVTPASRHSWDHMNKLGSPYSFSSLGRASCSSESSVICEAKKRLSERWASVVSKGVNQEHMQVRSLSTLGEMLAIPEVKKEGDNSRELDVSSNQPFGEEEEAVSITETKDGANAETSSRNFSRSKSVPATTSTYDKNELNAAVSKSRIIKPNSHKEEMKPKNGKISFKGKVSSFFFSRTKKPSQERPIPEIATKKDLIHGPEETKDLLPSATVTGGSKKSIFSAKAMLSLEKFSVSETPTETHEQPSPVSVLEARFEDEAGISMLQSSQNLDNGNLQTLSRSAPIESIARSLTWDDTCMQISSDNPLKLTRAAFEADEEREHFDFIEKLFSSAGLDDMSSKTIFSRWHSSDCPLDRVLLGGFLDQKEEETKNMGKRLNQRLLFDCVNAALLEIGQAAIYNAYPHARSFAQTRKDVPCGTSAAEVWKLMRDKVSAEGKYSSETSNNNVLIDEVTRKEVGGSEWTELLWWELNEISEDIGKKVLEELIRETLSDLTDPCLC